MNPVQLADWQEQKDAPNTSISDSAREINFTEQEIPGKSLAILFCHSSIMKCRMDLNPENVQNIGTLLREVSSYGKFHTFLLLKPSLTNHFQ